MVAVPEIARQVDEFEDSFDKDGITSNVTHPDRHHHEHTKSVQEKFVHDIWSLVTTIEEMGNPFMEESMDTVSKFQSRHAREGCKRPEEHLFAGKAKF